MGWNIGEEFYLDICKSLIVLYKKKDPIKYISFAMILSKHIWMDDNLFFFKACNKTIKYKLFCSVFPLQAQLLNSCF